MKKCLFLIILIGLFIGKAFSQIVAVDANNVTITIQRIEKQSVNQICQRSSNLDAAAKKADTDCQQALAVQATFISNQQNNAVQP